MKASLTIFERDGFSVAFAIGVQKLCTQSLANVRRDLQVWWYTLKRWGQGRYYETPNLTRPDSGQLLPIDFCSSLNIGCKLDCTHDTAGSSGVRIIVPCR